MKVRQILGAISVNPSTTGLRILRDRSEEPTKIGALSSDKFGNLFVRGELEQPVSANISFKERSGERQGGSRHLRIKQYDDCVCDVLGELENGKSRLAPTLSGKVPFSRPLVQPDPEIFRLTEAPCERHDWEP